MYQDKKILCVIPARGGSKRLPGKNVMPFLGKPMIGYAIAAAKQSKHIDRIVVSTDDEAIARVAREEGAEVIMRPAELATDEAPTLPVLQHALGEIEKEAGPIDVHVLIQPNIPGVVVGDVDGAIEKFFETGANSCITVARIAQPPEWMYRRAADGMLEKYISAKDARSQELEELYIINGAVYVTKRDVLMADNKIIDQASCTSVVMPRERSTDIDTATDFAIAEALLRRQ